MSKGKTEQGMIGIRDAALKTRELLKAIHDIGSRVSIPDTNCSCNCDQLTMELDRLVPLERRQLDCIKTVIDAERVVINDMRANISYVEETRDVLKKILVARKDRHSNTTKPAI